MRSGRRSRTLTHGSQLPIRAVVRGAATDSRLGKAAGTPDGVGGLLAARGEAAAAGLLSAEPQVALWHRIMRYRYLVVLALAAALVPAAGDRRFWISAGLILVALPYNALYEHLLRRTGVLNPTVAFADVVLAVTVFALVPEVWAPVAMLLVAVAAHNVVAFGRRVAAQAMMVGYLGYAVVTMAHGLVEVFPTMLVLGALMAFTLFTVGMISEDSQELSARYRELTGNVEAVVWEMHRSHPDQIFVSTGIERLTGYLPAHCRRVRQWEQLVHPDDRVATLQRYRQAVHTGQTQEIEYRVVSASGEVVWLQDRVRVELDPTGAWQRVAGVAVDVTGMKEAERQVSQFVNLVDNIHLGLVVCGLDQPDDPDDTLRVRALNPAAARLVGADRGAVVGQKASAVLPLSDTADVIQRLALVIRSGIGFTIDEYRLDGLTRPARVYSVMVFPLPGNAVAIVLNDVTERTMAAEVLRRQALHDGLTGLPNRTLLNERIRNALKRSRRAREPVSLLVMDLDHFKDVNDALGHEQGDRLLIEISRRLQSVVLEADTIARLGGDEFAVLLTDNADEESALTVAKRIREALEEPFQLGGITLESSASIGIAVSPAHGADAETLVQRADVAMYAAKKSGAGASLYARELDQSSVRRLALLGELRSAITEDDLRLRYQPSLDLRTGTVTSAEALVRWQHPEHGLLPPSEFIELAEVSGLIRPLTRWVIDNVLAQMRTWQQENVDLCVAVNLSVKDLYDRDLVTWLDDRLDAWGVDASRLKLEITESEVMDDPLLALEVLGRLKKLGVSTSIDDFGTGYSSLAYLKHLPIDELKIDKSFVGNLVHDANDLVIVRSTIDLSHNLGLRVVAEGVEDFATLQRLAELRCDRAQGFFVSRPVPGEEVPRWLAAHHQARQRMAARKRAKGA
jgi:diguanylate cyclase (GGDEF)-like protein/PAS domain S-box-containing protein